MTVLVAIQERGRSLGSNLYPFAATMEVERRRAQNPPVPTWLAPCYDDRGHEAWTRLLRFALDDLRKADDRLLVASALAVLALAMEHLKLGAFLDWLDPSDLDELLEGRLAWSEPDGAAD